MLTKIQKGGTVGSDTSRGAPRTVIGGLSFNSLLLFGVALAIRLAWTWRRDLGDPVPFGTDSVSYDAFARAILSGTSWISHPGPELFRPPGYPMALAVLYALFGGHLALVQLSQSLVGATSVLLVYEFGRRHAGATPALLAALWLLVNPLHLEFNGKLLRETWLVLLNVGLVASLLADDGRRARGVWRTALLFTLLAHFDSRYLFHLPFFAVYYALAPGGRPAGAARWLSTGRAALLFVLATLVFSAPWAIRNAVAYDRFVLIDTRALDRWGRRAQSAVAGDADSPARLLADFEAGKTARLDSLGAEERQAFERGIRPRFGQPHKAIFNLAEFWRIVHVQPEYRPFPDARFASRWSRSHNLSSLLFMGLLLPGFLLGAWWGLTRWDRFTLVIVAFIAVHTLLHVLVHSVVRYRLPVEPLYALVSFREMVRWFRGRSRPAEDDPPRSVA